MSTLKRIAKYLLLWVLVIGALQLSVSAEMSEDTVTQINTGIDTWTKVCEAIPKDAKSPLFKLMGEMAPFLGAAGGFVSLILAFLPQQDSAELTFMKQKFAEVNTKLDKITTQLDHLENLVTLEAQKAAYLTAANKIKFGFQKLNEFFNELEKTDCANEKDCERIRANIALRYVADFDIQSHLYMILSGAVSKGTFNEPLLDLLRKTYSCDIEKLDIFANGILKLALKAQMVIITHEKITGSKISVVNSMKTWLGSTYDLREYLYKQKNLCYENIKQFMLTDIKNSKYQTDFTQDSDANEALRVFMRQKYGWLDWNAYSYDAHGGDNHYMLNVDGAFWNIPQSKEDRKRNLVVASVDTTGTYGSQGFLLWKAVEDIAAKSVCDIGCNGNLEKLLDMITLGLKKRAMWKFVLSLNIVKVSIKTSVLAADPLTYINQVVTFKEKIQQARQGQTSTVGLKVRLLITVKSQEMASDKSCDKSCNDHGQCIELPYSSEEECQCKREFDGDDCKKHSKNGIASTIDALIATTIRLPTLVDIYYNVDDLRDDVNVGFGNIEKAINDLRSTLIKSYDQFGKEMSQGFAWVNLQILYSKPIQKINYYSFRFNKLINSTNVVSEGRELAEAVLGVQGVREWVYLLDKLFMGNTVSVIGAHEPFMIMFMDSNIDQACSNQYKVDVDNVYRQLVILQQRGYIIWAQALEILEMDTNVVTTTYKKRLEKQDLWYTSLVCQYAVANSVNIQCSGGRYIHPSVTLTNKCKTNFYVSGQSTTTCESKASTCKPCSCYAPGSDGSECEDITGKCRCKSGFYGDKCENRDCVWSNWSGFSSCSRKCDYGGRQSKSRTHKIRRVGNGRTCTGSYQSYRSCFHGCCSYQFHCSNKKKCISGSFKCDYDNDCGDNQDESNCDESCSYKYTPWNSAGKGKVYYLDRHNADCGSSQHVLQMFHLQTSGSNIRYQYKCCRLNKDIASYKLVSNTWTYTYTSSIYLDRQVVRCPSDSYINGVRLDREGDRLSYRYYCDKLDESKHRSRQSCTTSSTSSTYDGKGKNFYLDRQVVDCGRSNRRSFLNHFHLKRSGDNRWYYEYTCCRVLS